MTVAHAGWVRCAVHVPDPKLARLFDVDRQQESQQASALCW